MRGELIAITGGIGAGKSVVSNILRLMGYDVYDCDSRAKNIINTDCNLKRDICENICADAFFADGTYNHKAVSAQVFAEKAKMEVLNSLVHRAVFADINKWRQERSRESENTLFVESAILYSSGLWREAKPNMAWIVTAPEDIRIQRVIRRNGLTEEQIRARMAAQNFGPSAYPIPFRYITNDDTTAVLPQILNLLQ